MCNHVQECTAQVQLPVHKPPGRPQLRPTALLSERMSREEDEEVEGQKSMIPNSTRDSRVMNPISSIEANPRQERVIGAVMPLEGVSPEEEGPGRARSPVPVT